MVPQILSRVLHQPRGDQIKQDHKLTPKPAVLHGFQRRRVKWADYPGIIPSTSTSTTAGTGVTTTSTPATESNESNESNSVLGTLVTGLTNTDIQKLDLFEGSEYEKQIVSVRVLREGDAIGGRREESAAKSEEGHVRDVLDAVSTSTSTSSGTGIGTGTAGEEVQALTYVYIAGEDQLEDGFWDFEDFKKEKLGKWVRGEVS